MTTKIYNPEKEQAVIQTGLHELTAQLVNTFIPMASANKSFFVNDIPAQLPMATNYQMLASVLSGLLSPWLRMQKKVASGCLQNSMAMLCLCR